MGFQAGDDMTVITELDATDAPGVYLFDMTQAETNGDLIIVSAVSSTSNIDLQPAFIYTVQQLVFTVAGQVDANVQSINDAGVVGDGNAIPWDGV